MHFAGRVHADAPDPMDALRARAAAIPFPVIGLTPQRTVEDHGGIGIGEGRDTDGLWEQCVSITYTLWRNPDDRADPANLAELDDLTRAALDEVPPWPRPDWLVEGAERLRYPMLWEAVRTAWHRERSEQTALTRQLADHANHILMNRFREELGLQTGLSPSPERDDAWRVSESAFTAATLEIDGHDVPASEIDTDPFVYAIGARLSSDVVVTVVLARDDLPYVRLTLATRSPG